jgi:hypothetical protein
MPCGVFLNYATCHNFGPSTIIINDGNQYFFKSIFFHNHMCQFIMDGWKLLMSTWCYGYSCTRVA